MHAPINIQFQIYTSNGVLTKIKIFYRVCRWFQVHLLINSYESQANHVSILIIVWSQYLTETEKTHEKAYLGNCFVRHEFILTLKEWQGISLHGAGSFGRYCSILVAQEVADKAGHGAAHRDLPPTSKLNLLKIQQAYQIVQSAGEHSFMSLWGAFHSQYITIWILLLYIHDEKKLYACL